MGVAGVESAVESVKEGLRRAGASRVAVSKAGACILLEAPLRSGDVLVAMVREGRARGRYVVKLTLASRLASYGLSCTAVEYCPHGLFVIGSPEELAERVAGKALKLSRRARQ